MRALAGALDLELRAAHVRMGSSPEVSVQFVVDLIGAMAPDKGKIMLEALHEVDQQFGDDVAERVFTFEDMANLADQDLQVILRNVEMNVLVLALKGTPEALKARLTVNLSQRGQERLEEEMEMLGAVPVSQVQDAQRQICHQARQLAEKGEISLESGAEEYVE